MLRAPVACLRSSLPGRPLAVLGARTFAKKGKGSSAATEEVIRERSYTHVPINIMKGGADPELKPDSEYPEWVWGLTTPLPNVPELLKKGRENLSVDDLKRFNQLLNREHIKRENQKRAK